MKAILIHKYGHAEELKLEEVMTPQIANDQVLVRVIDAGVNPVDWKIREGMATDRFPVEFPNIMGQDFAGEIEKVGDFVHSFQVGDEVFGFADGSYAEYVAVPISAIARKPKTLDFVAAAAIPTAALTAWQSLFDHGELRRGQTILIHGAGGGVGSFACQIAKWKGVRVIATADAADRRYLESLGVDVIFDYQADRFEESIQDVDCVLDLIGGQTQRLSLEVMKKGGTLVSTVHEMDQAKMREMGLTGKVMMMERNGSQLAEIADLVEKGYLTPRLGGIFNLEEAGEAQEFLRTGHPHGKVVIRVC